jgi:uncharacterized protein YkwD
MKISALFTPFRPYLPLIAGVLLMAILSALSGQIQNHYRSGQELSPKTASASADIRPIPTLTPDRFAREVVELTNSERQKTGLPALQTDRNLIRSGTLKAQDMIKSNYWEHTSPAGTEPWYFFQKVGFEYSEAGENLSQGFATPQLVVSAWMDSEKHRKNILDPRFTRIGVIVVYDTSQASAFSSPLVVQHFAALQQIQAN